MEHIYRKLFTIWYNNKQFCIFLDENNRRTFLEINKKGEYVYPSLDDFTYLHNLYNNYDPFTFNHNLYKFKEFVQEVGKGFVRGVIIGVIVSSMGIIAHSTLCKYDIELQENMVVITQKPVFSSEKEQVEILDVNQLDTILGYKEISVEKIHTAIDKNDKIPANHKRYAHLFLNHLVTKYPNVDLRIFYENIKDVDYFIVDPEYFANQGTKNIGGQYQAISNRLVIPTNISIDDLYHELSHLTNSYYRENDTKIIYRNRNNSGFILGEAMTNVTASCITDPSSYDKYGAILEYFRNYVSFDYYDYNQKGIWYLTKQLQEKYPTVDINYIITALDTMSIEEKNSDYICLDQVDDLLDELFEICKIEASQTNTSAYKSFAQYAKLLHYTTNLLNNDPSILYDYLEKYNALLREKNPDISCITKEDIINKTKPFEDAIGIFYQENTVIPMTSIPTKQENTNQFILGALDEEGKHIYFSYPETYRCYVTTDSKERLQFFMKLSSIENYDIFGTSKYWETFAQEYMRGNPYYFKPIPLYWNGDLLGDAFLQDLKIAIELSPDGDIAYLIIDKERNALLQTKEIANPFIGFIPFSNFLGQYHPKNLDSLELTNILNDDYLMNIIEEENIYQYLSNEVQMYIQSSSDRVLNSFVEEPHANKSYR